TSSEGAVEDAEDDERGEPVDAPLPADGDDARDVFDAAADEDVSDEDDIDLPVGEGVPESDGDAPAAAAASSLPEASGSEPVAASGSESGENVDSLGVATDQGTDAGGAAGGGAAIPAQGRKRAGPGPAVAGEGARTPGHDLADAERAPIDDAELRAALEAILLVVDDAVAETH